MESRSTQTSAADSRSTSKIDARVQEAEARQDACAVSHGLCLFLYPYDPRLSVSAAHPAGRGYRERKVIGSTGTCSEQETFRCRCNAQGQTTRRFSGFQIPPHHAPAPRKPFSESINCSTPTRDKHKQHNSNNQHATTTNNNNNNNTNQQHAHAVHVTSHTHTTSPHCNPGT